MQQYSDFLASKQLVVQPSGFAASPGSLDRVLFPFQRDATSWALRLGRAALFEERGMGKTIQQLVWSREVANHTGGRILIICPLAVAHQTIREARELLGMGVTYVRNATEVDAAPTAVVITNYDRLLTESFDPAAFAGVVLDESSRLKHFSSKTRQLLTGAFRTTPFKLCCTATPSPNDIVELGSHAEFLGVMTSGDMLTRFFIRDSNKASTFQLRGHARRDFWQWIAEWAICLSRPSDLDPAYSDVGYDLPPLTLVEHVVDVDHTRAWEPDARGQLPMFLNGNQSAIAMWSEKRATLTDRIAKVAAIVADLPPTDPLILWHLVDAERDAIQRLIPEATIVTGSQAPELKEQLLTDFTEGRARLMATKPEIGGWGLNWQHCNQMIFCSLNHKFELFYQAMGRCHRFGQQRPVSAHLVFAESEMEIVNNLRHKWAQHHEMQQQMIAAMHGHGTLGSSQGTEQVLGEPIELPTWLQAA